MRTHVERIEDVTSFSRLKEEWNTLLRASAADCPFLRWEWLHSWWTHLAGHRKLHLLTVRRGPELIAIAPLAQTRGVPTCLPRLELLGTGHAGSDHLDFIVHRDWEAEAESALAGYLESHHTVLRLDHLRGASQAERVARRLAGGRWAVGEDCAGICPFIPLEGHSWDSFLATLGSSHRYNVRRRIRTLGTKFNMRFDRVASEKDRCEALTALVALHNRRWADRGGSTAFYSPALRAFHSDVTRLALEGGWLRLYVLTLDDAPAAVQYLLGYGGRFYFFQHGYDSQYSRHSIGLVSFSLAIRAAIEEGATEFDMLWGIESYKRLWSRESRTLRRIDVFPPDLRGVIQRRTTDASRGLRSVAKRLLGRPGHSDTDES